MPVVCAACGTENREAAKFCRGCGARLAGAAPARSEEEPARRLIVSSPFRRGD